MTEAGGVWWARVGVVRRVRHRRQARLCIEAKRRVQELVDGEVPAAGEARRLQRHIDACPPCAASADTVRELKEAVARVGRRTDPATDARLRTLADALCRGEPPDPET